MQVNDEVAHMGVVDGLLRFGLPRDVGGRVVRKDADNIDFFEIPEFVAAEFGQFAAQYEMQ